MSSPCEGPVLPHNRCGVGRCSQRAAEWVAHPHRPEDETPLCAHHAACVADELDAAVEELS